MFRVGAVGGGSAGACLRILARRGRSVAGGTTLGAIYMVGDDMPTLGSGTAL